MPHEIRIIDNKYLFLVNQFESTLIVYDIKNLNKLKEIKLKQKGAGHFAYHSESDHLIIGGRNFSGKPDMTEAEKTIKSQTEILNVFKSNNSSLFELPHGEMLSLDCKKTDKGIYSLGTLTNPKHLCFFDMNNSKFIDKIQLENEPKGVAFSKAKSNVFYFTTLAMELFVGVITAENKLKIAQIDELGNGQHLNLF